jgi:shikimate kinase/3-dehydroquinate synthase
MWRRIALIGFSGTGKSATARLLADELAWTAIDLDDDLETQFGMTIPEIFATRGEAKFRAAERAALTAACVQDRVVIATGGGAAVADDAWTNSLLGNPNTLTVALDASPETSLRRLQAQQEAEGARVARPMLEGDHPLARIASLKAARQHAYDRALITLPVDRSRAAQVASDIASLIEPVPGDHAESVILDAPGGTSRIVVATGLLKNAGTLISSAFPRAQRAWIVSDENVGRLHGHALAGALAKSGLAVSSTTVPPGESSKSLACAGTLYDWLLGGGIERTDVVVALGGGVIGDLAGFVAATVLRGAGLVQVPTSLLAMVDSSVGGKTGINHAAGKNLIGSFYQPPLVLIDPATLRTLPPRELRQGWAEVIKHAIIQPSTPGGDRADLLPFLERNAARLMAIEEPALSYLIRRNVALKSRVVEADEREAGIRAYLNFGHTLGHAIEASDYRLLHGEAVALGMRAAAQLSLDVNDADPEIAARLNALLDRFDLPKTAEIDRARALSLMQSDKKRVAGRQRWVLMKSGGGVEIREGIAEHLVARVLDVVAAPNNNVGASKHG